MKSYKVKLQRDTATKTYVHTYIIVRDAFITPMRKQVDGEKKLKELTKGKNRNRIGTEYW